MTVALQNLRPHDDRPHIFKVHNPQSIRDAFKWPDPSSPLKFKAEQMVQERFSGYIVGRIAVRRQAKVSDDGGFINYGCRFLRDDGGGYAVRGNDGHFRFYRESELEAVPGAR